MILALLLLLWVIPVVFLVAGFGSLPRPERFLLVNDLAARPIDVEHVRSVLRRTYRSRIAGGLTGLVIGGFAGSRLGPTFAIGGAGVGLLMGTMLGIAVAQSRRRDVGADTTRSASLVARDPVDYRPAHATRTTVGLALVLLAYGGFAIATADGELRVTLGLFAVGFATVLAVPLGRFLQRRTVEMRRVNVDPESARVDDALRANAVRGIHHATVGVLMCGLLLIGYGAVSTQSYLGMNEGSETLLRTPPLSRHLWTSPVGKDRVRVHWIEVDGSAHSDVVPALADAVYGNIWTNDTLVAIGYWAAFLGFFGALVQWARAAKAWRRPQRAPDLSSGTANATVGAAG